jgi:S-methylmethionine-dependent homocysteine/selenocysteine methylase
MAAPWRYVSDGGLETDLIFHHGVDLPEFAAYPLLRSADGRALLRWYFEGYASIAQRARAGLRLESPTWRANPDWGEVLGHDAAALDAANQEAIAFLRGIQHDWSDRIEDIVVVGMLGPRGDGYAAGSASSADEAAEYHRAQVASFASAGVDEVEALTMTDALEAQGVAMAAASLGLPAVLSFTVETDGRLPDGTSLGDAVTAVDEAASPAYFMVNCAHPQHVLKALDQPGPWVERIRGLRSNASTLTHAELDEAETLDEGDLDVLVPAHRALEERLPGLEIVGGCCGTDARHVAALWGVGVT